MRMTAGIACLLLLLNIPTCAEIEKSATVCDSGVCFHWWPKLPKVSGWHQDEDESLYYGMNALAPDGSSFTKAEAVMYANAIYKPRVPTAKSLDIFMRDDKEHFLTSDPGITITEVAGLVTGDGQKLRSFTFAPESKGNWEEVSYGEEDDFYLTFVISSRTKEGFDKSQNDYRNLVVHYKVHLP